MPIRKQVEVVGEDVGLWVGESVGATGPWVGEPVGALVGFVGAFVGEPVDSNIGAFEGLEVGEKVGFRLGSGDSSVFVKLPYVTYIHGERNTSKFPRVCLFAAEWPVSGRAVFVWGICCNASIFGGWPGTARAYSLFLDTFITKISIS